MPVQQHLVHEHLAAMVDACEQPYLNFGLEGGCCITLDRQQVRGMIPVFVAFLLCVLVEALGDVIAVTGGLHGGLCCAVLKLPISFAG
jgi:hypothetical protein